MRAYQGAGLERGDASCMRRKLRTTPGPLSTSGGRAGGVGSEVDLQLFGDARLHAELEALVERRDLAAAELGHFARYDRRPVRPHALREVFDLCACVGLVDRAQERAKGTTRLHDA